jgi:hypothetical protein
MKNLKYFLLSLFLMMGCNNDEFFELEHPAQDPWQSVEEFEFAAVAPYGLAFNNSWDNFYISDVVLEFIQSDLMHFSGNQEGYTVNEFINRQTTERALQMETAFENCYKVIGSCNAGLDFYYSNDGDPFPEASLQDKRQNVDRIAGELHFMRAFANFANVRRHAPQYDPDGSNDDRLLPLRVSFPENLEQATKPYFATTAEIYTHILEDLQKAKELLPETYNSAQHPSYRYGRATRFTSAALLARVLFQMRNWDAALEELNYIIDQGPFTLEPEPIDLYNKQDLGTASNELIWYIDYSDPIRGVHYGPKKATLFTKNHYPATNGGRGENWSICPWNQFSLSSSALAQTGWMVNPLQGNYTETDAAIADKRYRQVYYRMEGFSSDVNADPTLYRTDQKYSNLARPVVYGDKYYRAPVGMNGFVPIIRLAEMYLSRSIIRLMKNDPTGAAADLNMVRNRAWDESVGGPFQPVTAQDITAELIHTERIKELAFEGDRLYYLMALGLPVGPGDRGEDVPNRVLEAPYQEYYWMISQDELDFKEE